MKSLIAISVVIPAYNEEKLIDKCLTSLKNQDFKLPWEIIVVNNNSTDKTAEIIQKYPQVKLITESVQGVVSARQRGLKEARGEIVVGADCDCIYPPNWLSKIYANFQKDHQIVAVGGPGIGEKHPWWAYRIHSLGFNYVNFIYRLTKKVIYLSGFNFSFKRQIFLDLGGYHTYLDFGGDEIDPLKRLKKAGHVIYNHSLKIKISSRRYRVGFFKFIFVHMFYYYFLNYLLASIFKRTIIKARAVR